MTVEVEAPIEDTNETGDQGPKQLREALKRSQDEAAEYRAELMESAWEKIGLNPEVGLGKAIAKEYKGKPTEAALAEYAASEYGHNVPDAPENPAEPEIKAGTEVQETVNAASTPVVPDVPEERQRKAEQTRDWDTAGRVKADKLRKMMRP